MSVRSISIFGATGSVGTATLDLIGRTPDQYRIIALTARHDAAGLAALARLHRAERAVVADRAALPLLRELLVGTGIRADGGEEALVDAAGAGADWTMAAIVGCAGLAPTMAALAGGNTVALANKESLVSAGSLMMDAAARSGATLLPVDSEHNAIFQCLAGGGLDTVRRIILTASGGPFRRRDAAAMATVTPAEAVRHPNWSMGAKISVDSATMMNKGLELIEAAHLFPIGLDRLEIIVHPQSVVHSMVEYRDGSILAQLGPTDMRVPIASALAWPTRMDSGCRPLDLAGVGRLDFEKPDPLRFPALRLAREAAEVGGIHPATLNAANEVAVAAFLAGQIGFLAIADIVARVLDATAPAATPDLHAVFSADAAARNRASSLIGQMSHAG